MQASNWIIRLSTGVIVVRSYTRAAAIKRAIQEEWIRVGGKLLFDRMGCVGKMHVAFKSCEPRTWWDSQEGYEVDFDDTEVGGCSCGFRAHTTDELAEHHQQHEDDDWAKEVIEEKHT